MQHSSRVENIDLHTRGEVLALSYENQNFLGVDDFYVTFLSGNLFSFLHYGNSRKHDENECFISTKCDNSVPRNHNFRIFTYELSRNSNVYIFRPCYCLDCQLRAEVESPKYFIIKVIHMTIRIDDKTIMRHQFTSRV